MKKLLIISLCLSTVFVLSACSSSEPEPTSSTDSTTTESTQTGSTDNTNEITYKDGVYEATGDTTESNGYTSKVSITVENGAITDVDYNGFNENGTDKKTESHPEGNYTYDMVSAGGQSDWYVQAELLEDALIQTQDPAKINVDSEGKTDSVAGVSIKASEFVELSTEALEQAK